MSNLLLKAHSKGTDSQYRAWVQMRPSCISNRFSEYLESGEGRCVAAHVRRSSGSGTAYKEPYCVVPLTQIEHNLQHQQGERAVLERFKPKPGGWTVEEAKEWFNARRMEYLELWLMS